MTTTALPERATDEISAAARVGVAPGGVAPGRSREGRAVILVGNPAAPYSRAVRLARTLTREGYEVEIAAVAAPGLPSEERSAHGLVRRYGPSGAWSRVGRAASDGGGARDVAPAASDGGVSRWSRATLRRAVGRAGRAIGALRRWLFWPHTVRGWWSTLARDLAPADLYHATGSLTVAAALAARRRAPIGPNGLPARVIYDVIDDVMESNNVLDMPAPLRALHGRREARWAAEADGLTTVNEPLAGRLGRRWGRPLVVVPNYPEIPATDPATRIDARADAEGGPLRRALGVGPEARIVIFQGRLGPRLGLDEAAEAVLSVPGAILVILGFGRGFGRSRARDAEPPFVGRHVTLEARDPDDLLAWTADADVAVIPLPPVSVNQRLSSPNKLWEAIAAGTPVVVPSSLTYMADLVRAEDLGVVAASASATDLAVGIRAAFERLAGDPGWRAQIRATAREHHAWPIAEARYIALVRGLRPNGPR